MEFGQLVSIMWDGILQTLYMTVVSTLLAYILGIPLGVVLYITDKDGMRVYKRGLIYIIAKAFSELYPQALLTVD